MYHAAVDKLGQIAISYVSTPYILVIFVMRKDSIVWYRYHTANTCECAAFYRSCPERA